MVGSPPPAPTAIWGWSHQVRISSGSSGEAPLTSTDEFDYHLPVSSIAQQPLADRSSSRMLVLEGQGGERDSVVTALPELLRAGDCLVINDTRVRAARLRGQLGDLGVEVLLVGQVGDDRYEALTKPAKAFRPGSRLAGKGWTGLVLGPWAPHPGGRLLLIWAEPGMELSQLGEVPLPPYLREPLLDPDRYQTVYAAGPGVSAAAPTAGLHLTRDLLGQIRDQGVEIARVQLEVGIGTFAPMRARSIEEHSMHSEPYTIPQQAAGQIEACRSGGGRVVAVGTTVVRCLESNHNGAGGVLPGTGSTDLFLRPGIPFQVVDGLLTNFHQPRSSLLVLVSACFGMERVRQAYRHALSGGYRFLSFGDCMFGWREG